MNKKSFLPPKNKNIIISFGESFLKINYINHGNCFSFFVKLHEKIKKLYISQLSTILRENLKIFFALECHTASFKETKILSHISETYR